MRLTWAAGLIILFALLTQCAKQTAPTGGPKDETPPKLLKSTPKHEQTNVKNNKLTLTFDELIQLNNPREQIIITPSVGKKFEATFSKREVELDLKAELQKNTTYSINLREAVQDLSERNPALVKIAFSTGDYIDSLHITGKVFDALSEKEAVNYVVALAEASDTFNIFKHAASWITLTDKRGRFSLENLKPGEYFLYAFDDRSKNLIVDSKSEKYGFLKSNIKLEKNTDSVSLRTFKLDISKFKIITARPTFAYYNIRFSKSLTDFNLTSADSSAKIYSTLETDLSTVKIYNTLPNMDSLKIRVQATDSLSAKIDTLLYIKFAKKESTRDKFSTKVETPVLQESNSILNTTIVFSKPVTTFKPDSARIEIDSTTRISFTSDDFRWNSLLNKLYISKKIDPALLIPKDTSKLNLGKTNKPTSGATSTPIKIQPRLVLPKGVFVSLEKDTAITTTTPISIIKQETTGIIEVKVNTQEDVIIQLLKGDLIIRETVKQKEVTFENLPPGNYSVRVLIDLNKNGKWDPGNINLRTEPEPIIYYRNRKNLKEMPLKANWTLDGVLITY